MSYRSYLSRSRTGSFHFRLRLCSMASEVLGLREIRQGPGTQDRLEAQRRALDLYQAVGSLQKVHSLRHTVATRLRNAEVPRI